MGWLVVGLGDGVEVSNHIPPPPRPDQGHSARFGDFRGSRGQRPRIDSAQPLRMHELAPRKELPGLGSARAQPEEPRTNEISRLPSRTLQLKHHVL